MPVASAPKLQEMSKKVGEGADPKQVILEAVGDLAGVEVLSDLVLVGTYPESTILKSITRNDGSTFQLLKNDDQVKEAQYQSKVGLVLKTGPLAYADWEEGDEIGKNAAPHTWVTIHVGDGWPLQINGTPCRLVPYEKIRLRVKDPSIIY